jgi:hypothetical protein
MCTRTWNWTICWATSSPPVSLRCALHQGFSPKTMYVPLISTVCASCPVHFILRSPRRRKGKWIYRSTFSWRRDYLEVSGQLCALVASPPPPGGGGRDPCTPWIGSWVDARPGLDDIEKWKFFILSGLELQLLGRPAHSSGYTDYITATHCWG